MSWSRIAVAGIALFVGASVAEAQGMRGQDRGQAMIFSGITLTVAQQQKVDAVRDKYRGEREKLMPNGMAGGRPDSATRAKMMAITTKQNAELRALLDPEQQKTFDRNLEAQKARREQMRSRRS